MRNLIDYTYIIPAILIALTIHEFSHAYVAYLFGDDTARLQGRLTLNPLKHLDILGTIMIFVVGFGFAKPVPINPNNFTKRKLGMGCVSFAGVLSNLVMAFISLIIIILFDKFHFDPLLGYINKFLSYFIYLNVILAVFNLLPVPPLDGSNIIMPFLPSKASEFVYRNMTIMYLVLIMLLYFNILTPVIRAMSDFVIGIMQRGIMLFF